jgi:hypothetical protein
VPRRNLSAAVRRRIRKEARERCGYCLSPQSLVLGTLEIEHIIPRAKGGSNEEANLWLSCSPCNAFKGVQTEAVDPHTGSRVALFDPRRQKWDEHFEWSEDGAYILGKTAAGRATILALQLNNAMAVATRRLWVSAGWHPPPGAHVPEGS